MVAFAETPGETGGQEEGTYDGNTDEEKRDPESIMAAEGGRGHGKTEQRSEKEEAENGAGELKAGSGEGEVPDRKRRLLREGSGIPGRGSGRGGLRCAGSEKSRKERKLLNKQPSGRGLWRPEGDSFRRER